MAIDAGELQIEDADTGKRFAFRGVDGLNDAISQPVISVPLVNTTPDTTFLFRFFGQSETYDFTFALYNDGNDVSNGDNIFTIDQQIDYLKNTIYGDSFDTTWVLIDPEGRWSTALTGKQVVITNLKFNQKAGAGTVVMGSITLQRGKVKTI